MRKYLSVAILATLSLATTVAAQGALSAPCFVTQYGTNLNLIDDSLATGTLGFTFPGPGGVNVTSIDISSNGFVWLGSSMDAGCCYGDPFAFVSDLPRLAPLWMDLNPSTSGAVWFNTFPASGGQGASAVVTWDGVPEYGSSSSAPMTFQLQMFDDGSFLFAYQASVANEFHDVLVGVTEGIAAVANVIDFSATTVGTPHLSGTNPTVFEVQSAAFDIAGRSFAFVDNLTGGYLVVDRPTCAFANSSTYGFGCPKPSAAYELFDVANVLDLSNTAIDFVPTTGGGYVAIPATGFFTGYSNAVPFYDDDVQPFTMPFAFPWSGGNVSTVDVSSNGFIWLSTGNFDPRCCNGDAQLFQTDPASIAVLWQDMNPNAGGSLYLDATATEAHITWAAVPEYGGGNPQTAQLTLRSDGSFRLAYQSVDSQFHDTIVGFSGGFLQQLTGGSDFSAGPVVVPNGGTPLQLSAAPGSRPVLGTTFTMNVDQIPAGSLLGVMVLGTTQLLPGVDLTFLGMDRCELYTTLDALLSFPLAGSPTPWGFPIPNNTALVGAVVFAQASTFTPGINAFGFAVSNGLAIAPGN